MTGFEVSEVCHLHLSYSQLTWLPVVGRMLYANDT